MNLCEYLVVKHLMLLDALASLGLYHCCNAISLSKKLDVYYCYKTVMSSHFLKSSYKPN